MGIVHYYLGRPAHVWIAANPRRNPARQAHKGRGRVTAASRASPREESSLLYPLRRTAQPMPARVASATGNPP
jgi:hypothetical protein